MDLSRAVAVIASLAALSACTTEITVEHYRAPCTGLSRMLCLMVHDPSEAPAELTYGGLEGLGFRNGFRQRAAIRKEWVPFPAMDGPNQRWIVVGEVSAEPVDPSELFTLHLMPGDLTGDAATGYLLVDEQIVTFASDAVRDSVLAANAGNAVFETVFHHEPDAPDRWIAVAPP